MEKKSRLMLAQVDNVSGEELGSAIQRIMELGAWNVQRVPTMTKKGRPGNVLLIDAAPELEHVMADYLARELKVSGYHRIETSHVFHQITVVMRNLVISVDGREMSFPCNVKTLGNPEEPLSMDVDHDFLVSVQRALEERCNCTISVVELRSMVEAKLRGTQGDIAIEIHGKPGPRAAGA